MSPFPLRRWIVLSKRGLIPTKPLRAETTPPSIDVKRWRSEPVFMMFHAGGTIIDAPSSRRNSARAFPAPWLRMRSLCRTGMLRNGPLVVKLRCLRSRSHDRGSEERRLVGVVSNEVVMSLARSANCCGLGTLCVRAAVYSAGSSGRPLLSAAGTPFPLRFDQGMRLGAAPHPLSLRFQDGPIIRGKDPEPPHVETAQ